MHSMDNYIASVIRKQREECDDIVQLRFYPLTCFYCSFSFGVCEHVVHVYMGVHLGYGCINPCTHMQKLVEVPFSITLGLNFSFQIGFSLN